MSGLTWSQTNTMYFSTFGSPTNGSPTNMVK